jgi:formylglycine-generating enzyme required for sulfatase activity
LDEHGWHYENSDEVYHQPGLKESNPWGLHDMLGNVSEWTLDQYQEDAYQQLAAMDEVNPWIKPTSLHPRTVRGGSWDNDPEDLSCTCRLESSRKWKERDPQIPKSFWWNTDSPFVGFRLLKPYDPPSAEEQAAFWARVLGD